MTFSGTSPDGTLVEIIELPDHPWFLAVQFHPEFKSKPTAAQPLFAGFVAAAVAHSHGKVGPARCKRIARSATNLTANAVGWQSDKVGHDTRRDTRVVSNLL